MPLSIAVAAVQQGHCGRRIRSEGKLKAVAPRSSVCLSASARPLHPHRIASPVSALVPSPSERDRSVCISCARSRPAPVSVRPPPLSDRRCSRRDVCLLRVPDRPSVEGQGCRARHCILKWRSAHPRSSDEKWRHHHVSGRGEEGRTAGSHSGGTITRLEIQCCCQATFDTAQAAARLAVALQSWLDHSASADESVCVS